VIGYELGSVLAAAPAGVAALTVALRLRRAPRREWGALVP
jgi:hypothetical protein